MFEIGFRLVWFVIATVTLSYGSYLFVGSSVQANERGSSKPVEVIDHLKPGVHQLSGMIDVPSSCHQLSVEIENTAPNVYTLEFVTWEEPSVPCNNQRYPRQFTTTAFAPAAGVHFQAELDGTPIPIIVRPKVIWERSASSSDIIQRIEE